MIFKTVENLVLTSGNVVHYTAWKWNKMLSGTSGLASTGGFLFQENSSKMATRPSHERGYKECKASFSCKLGSSSVSFVSHLKSQ